MRRLKKAIFEPREECKSILRAKRRMQKHSSDRGEKVRQLEGGAFRNMGNVVDVVKKCGNDQ